jgi:hypothetical protein
LKKKRTFQNGVNPFIEKLSFTAFN